MENVDLSVRIDAMAFITEVNSSNNWSAAIILTMSAGFSVFRFLYCVLRAVLKPVVCLF